MDTLTVTPPTDRAAVQEVRHRYAKFPDAQDWDALLPLFAPEVEAEFPDYGVTRQTVPRDIFLNRFYRMNLSRPGLKTQHLFTNDIVEIAGDRAVCHWQFVGHHYLPGAEGGEEFTLRGQYTDTLARIDTGWQIIGVTFRLLFATGNPGLLSG